MIERDDETKCGGRAADDSDRDEDTDTQQPKDDKKSASLKADGCGFERKIIRRILDDASNVQGRPYR